MKQTITILPVMFFIFVFCSFTYAVIIGADDLDLSGVSDETLANVNAQYILFGHQSVGENIIDGINNLEAKYQVTQNGDFHDFYVGSNYDPESKVNDFTAEISSRTSGGATINCAFFKFCYVDIDSSTDVDSLFSSYQAQISSLRSQYPDITFAHITAPLTTSGDTSDNIRRNQYNDLLRNNYSSDYIYDLAEIESTHADGSRCSFEEGGTTYYALCDEFTDDGGHLNSTGADRAARGLVAMLATIYQVDGGSAPTADFSASPTTVNINQQVQFTNQSTGTVTGCSWDFGDGATSTRLNPIHAYISAGTYNVVLTATNSGGSDTETKNSYITVTSTEDTPIYSNTTWYLAEGYTGGDKSFSSWILVQNPSESAADITAIFMKPDGSTGATSFNLPSQRRYSICVNNVEGFSNTEFSTKVQATNNVSIIAERAMYWNSGGVEWSGGHCSIGTTVPATTWYLAEGCTNGFNEYICIQNPSVGETTVQATFMDPDGNTVITTEMIPANSRRTIDVNLQMPDSDVSATVASIDDTGIVVERAMYWTRGSRDWVGGHCSIGVTAPAITWYLAEGCTNNFYEYVCIQNPSSEAATVNATFMDQDGNTVVKTETIAANSRTTINVNSQMADRDVSTTVESTNGVGIIAERAMYWDGGGISWVGGHATVGVTSSALTWYLAEGDTSSFDEYVLIQNPNSSSAQVMVTFMDDSGNTAITTQTLNPTSRQTITVSSHMDNKPVSTTVESTNGQPVIVERAMYWTSGGIPWIGGHNTRGTTD